MQPAAMNRFKESLIQFAKSNPNLFPPNPTTNTDYPTLINQQFSEFFTDFHTPNHPPYAAMINTAIQELNEKGGSSEESISKYIEEEYVDLPWAHSSLLKHHLEKLCDLKEICMTRNRCYLLVGADSDPISATTPEKQLKTSETGKTSSQSGKKQNNRQDLKLGKTSSGKGKKGKKQKSRLDSESAKISSKHHEKNKKKGKCKQITEVCQKEDQAIQALDDVADEQEKHDVCRDQEMEEGGVCANATDHNQTEKILLINHSDFTGSEDQSVELSNDKEQVGTCITKKRKNKQQKIMPTRSSKRSKKNEDTQLLVLSEANLNLDKDITDAASQEQKQIIEVKTRDKQIQEENKDVEVCQKEDQAIQALDEVADEQEKHDVCIDQELGETGVCANTTEQKQTEKILLIKHSEVPGSEDQSVELSNDKEQIGTKKRKSKKQKIMPTRSSKRNKKNDEIQLLVLSEENLKLDKEITDAASQEQKQMIEVKTSDTQIQEENKDVEVCQKEDQAIQALDEVTDRQETHDVCIDQELGEGAVCENITEQNQTEKILWIKHSDVTGSEDQSVELSNDNEQIGTKARKNKEQKITPTSSSKLSKKNEETQLLVLSEANLNLNKEITDAASPEQKQMIEVKTSDTQIQEENKDVEMALEVHSGIYVCKYMSDQISIGVQTSDTQIQEENKDVEMALDLHSDNIGCINSEHIHMEQSPPILELEGSSNSDHMLQQEGKINGTISLLKSVLKRDVVAGAELKRDVVAGSELTGSPGNANMPKGKLIVEHLSEEKQQVPSAVSTIMSNQRAKLRSSKKSTVMGSLDTEVEPQQKSSPSLEKPVVELVEPAQAQEAGNTQQNQQPDELKELKPKPKGRGRPPKKSRQSFKKVRVGNRSAKPKQNEDKVTRKYNLTNKKDKPKKNALASIRYPVRAARRR